MTIIFACDHAGFALKNKLLQWVGKNYSAACIDVGATSLNVKDDYPIFGRAGAHAVQDTKNALGIFICGSGAGMAITANRFSGIRAVQAESVAAVRRARREDHANVLVLGSRIISFSQAQKLVREFLQTRPSKAVRHTRRIGLIERVSP